MQGWTNDQWQRSDGGWWLVAAQAAALGLLHWAPSQTGWPLHASMHSGWCLRGTKASKVGNELAGGKPGSSNRKEPRASTATHDTSSSAVSTPLRRRRPPPLT